MQKYAEAQLQQELKDMYEASPIPERKAANLKRLDEILKRRKREPGTVHLALALLVIETFPGARIKRMVKQSVPVAVVLSL